MNRFYSVAASAALFAFTVSAAPRPIVSAPADQAQAALQEVQASSAEIAEAAFQLHALTSPTMDPAAHLSRLYTLKQEVNRIGADLRPLEAERDSLPEWQATAINRILPVMVNIAEESNRAIQIYGSDRNHLWATPYGEDVEQIYTQASEVKDVLGAYLKLASVEQQENRLESRLGEESGNTK